MVVDLDDEILMRYSPVSPLTSDLSLPSDKKESCDHHGTTTDSQPR